MLRAGPLRLLSQRPPECSLRTPAVVRLRAAVPLSSARTCAFLWPLHLALTPAQEAERCDSDIVAEVPQREHVERLRRRILCGARAR